MSRFFILYHIFLRKSSKDLSDWQYSLDFKMIHIRSGRSFLYKLNAYDVSFGNRAAHMKGQLCPQKFCIWGSRAKSGFATAHREPTFYHISAQKSIVFCNFFNFLHISAQKKTKSVKFTLILP